MARKVLIAGESWTCFTTHVKGMDTFYTSTYEEGVAWLREAVEKAGFEVVYVPNHHAQDRLPFTAEGYGEYAAVILSDIGSNTLLLPSVTFSKSEKRPNRCTAIRDYVRSGGALIMIGGYMSFGGIEGKARYGATAIADVLPVSCLSADDRREHSEGVSPRVIKAHPLTEGMDGQWPCLLGYNKTEPKSGCEVVVEIDGDPLIAAGGFGQGRSAVFTSDCSPHWAPHEFVNWKHYNTIWKNMLTYVVK
ncbi:MAG: glutamine amidotransferase [Treponema sp.]|jgi:uncharacterized membrane protein|nr:glutamine amidotransferase [Treponema sp.]